MTPPSSEARQTRRTILMAATAASYSRILGANDRISLGFIGVGERGNYLLQKFLEKDGVRVGAVCDVFDQRTAETRTKAPGATAFQDHRRVLEQKDLDGVVIATPDHWHA